MAKSKHKYKSSIQDVALIDEQIATAFLTGIVSATDRFSNNRTSSQVMTMAAQLMAAGANQQLIATELDAEIIPEPKRLSATQPAVEDAHVDPGMLAIDHSEPSPTAELPPVPSRTQSDADAQDDPDEVELPRTRGARVYSSRQYRVVVSAAD